MHFILLHVEFEDGLYISVLKDKVICRKFSTGNRKSFCKKSIVSLHENNFRNSAAPLNFGPGTFTTIIPFRKSPNGTHMIMPLGKIYPSINKTYSLGHDFRHKSKKLYFDNGTTKGGGRLAKLKKRKGGVILICIWKKRCLKDKKSGV
jgi:hypothetical protein